MKELARGGLFPTRGSLKINGVAAWTARSVLPLGSQESRGWTRAAPCMESLVTQECQESSHCVPDWPQEAGVRLPGARLDLLGGELDTAVRDTCSRFPTLGCILDSPIYLVGNLGHITYLL